ncbi:MAG TPA: PQQ-dependent sugar dehydrogenase [Kofleriaceae bacterium]|nr:PQQ-dependent sugar dehydrogenase [Kofleriaceae bacterium]
MRGPRFVLLSVATLGSACSGGSGKPIDAPPAAIDAAVDDAPIGPGVDASTDGPAARCTPHNGTTVMLAPVASGLDSPVGVTSPPGDPRLFVVEQKGRIRVIADGQLQATPFLDISGTAGPVMFGDERGLLGIAFHPQFATNHKFYLDFVRKPDNSTVIAELTTNAAGDAADVATRRDLLVIAQPYTNHKGGWLEFGPDGMLYIGMGDGGSGGDPQDRAQNDAQLLGKMLRIDVDTRTGTKPYGIPADNPHASSPDGPTDPRPEIWHKGLRNPFRWSFDRATGDLYIGDVGQASWEEVDYTHNDAPLNFGWDDREGMHCFEPMTNCLTADRVDPVTEHSSNDNWHAMIGGAVYRGTCFPDLVGTYFYGDYIAQELWSLRIVNGVAQDDQRLLQGIGALTSLHTDAYGEIYGTTYGGDVVRIVVP